MSEAAECSECGKPVQKPYRKVCSAECKAAKRKRTRKEDNRRWQKANSKKSVEYTRRWKKANPEKAKEAVRRRYKANPEKVMKRNRRRYEAKFKTDIRFRLGICLRSRLNSAIKRNSKSGSAVADLGCSIDELKLHLERQFDANMTWENWGPYWHIDHVKPLAAFDLTDREQILQAVHWTNLRPLEKLENIRKGARSLAGLPRGSERGQWGSS